MLMGTCRASLFRSYTFSSTLKPRSGILQRPELSGASYGASFPVFNLAQNFLFRVQIDLPSPRSPCGPLSGATDLARHTPIVAVSDQSGAELPLPCPDWPYIPSLTLGPTFRGHRPRLCTPSVPVPPSHQLHRCPRSCAKSPKK